LKIYFEVVIEERRILNINNKLAEVNTPFGVISVPASSLSYLIYRYPMRTKSKLMTAENFLNNIPELVRVRGKIKK